MITVNRITTEAVESVFMRRRAQDFVPHNADSIQRVRDAAAVATLNREDGLPIVLGGVTRFPDPGMTQFGNVWAVVTDEARGHGKAITRLARQVMGDWMKMLDFDALWTFTLLENMENRRWMTTLGFVPGEGEGSVVLDENGVAWKGYVLWECSEAAAAVEQWRKRHPPTTERCGSNTQAGLLT